mgnify:CR=1 FL=1
MEPLLVKLLDKGELTEELPKAEEARKRVMDQLKLVREGRWAYV